MAVAIAFVLASLGLSPGLRAEGEKAQADALVAGLGAKILQGEKEASLKALGEAMRLYRKAGDQRGEATCHLLQALASWAGGDEAAAAPELEQSLALRLSLGDRFDAWQVLWLLAENDKQEGRYSKAAAHLEQALDLLRELEGSSAPISLEGFLQVAGLFGAPVELFSKFSAMQAIAKPILLLYARVITHDTFGALLVDTGQLDQAEVQLDQARSSAALFGGMFDSSILTHVGDLRRCQWRLDEAKESYQKALSGLEMFSSLPFVKDARMEIQALDRLAEIDSLAGRLEDALRWNDRALDLVRRGGDRKREARVLQDRAGLFMQAGEMARAEQILNEARGIAEPIGDLYRQATLDADLGTIAMLGGRYEEAAKSLERSLAILRPLHEPYVEAGVWALLSEVYLLLEARGGARGTLEEAQKRSDETEFRAAQELTRSLAAWERFRSGKADLGEARMRFERTWQLAAAEGLLPRGDFSALLGGLFSLVEAPGETASAAPPPAPSTLAGSSVPPVVQLVTHFLQGRLNFKRGDFPAARSVWTQAMNAVRKLGNRDLAAVLSAAIGVAFWHEGKAAEAIAQLQAAVQLLEANVMDVKVEELMTSYLGSERRWYYELLVEMLLRQGRTQEAFAYTERARARAFLNLVGNRRLRPSQSADSQLVAESETLRAAIRARVSQGGGVSSPERDRAAQDLRLARERFEHLQLRLKVTNPEYASLVNIVPIQASDLQQDLPPGTTAISYFVTSLGVHAWILDREAVEYVALPLDSKGLAQAVCWANEVRHPRGAARAGSCDPGDQPEQGLYRALIAPLRDKIRNQRLVLVPHGDLHYVPFAALRDPQSRRYLIEDYTLTYAPSVSALHFLRGKESPVNGGALVLGNPANPAPDLTPLPGAEKEATAVALALGTTPVVGRMATEDRLYGLEGKVDLLHIAAHGIYEPDDPLFSRIALAPGGKQDGNLEVHEILSSLDLSGVNLVVLSACSTAIGERSGGDEVVGLTRALLYAGSPGVISTLWDIDDQAAAPLMAELYRRLLAGISVAEALQGAQLALLRGSEYSDPSYWAAFGLAGDPQGRWGGAGGKAEK
jgi:CHAT domain-containing protein